MRLINVNTWKLEEFMDRRRYAILSHTWGQAEVTFADFQRGLAHVWAIPSFARIYGACRQAASDGFEFVWVDTCCIDKSSSAELSEAINSMFRWYSDAEICYAYLGDVWVGHPEGPDYLFRKSKWFERGWTLQELLAPKKVVFFSRDWGNIRTKENDARTIAEITGIDPKALGTLDITKFSVAERMSWASGRETTRLEDKAYCLLGIFGVNMSLLYGEGERAFIRLEEEIIKISDDHSIFAWTSSSDVLHKAGGLLATSPSHFKHSRGIIKYDDGRGTSRPYVMTNKGLRIKMDLSREDKPEPKMEIFHGDGLDEFCALLDCRTRGGSVLAIRLRKSIPSKNSFYQSFSSFSSTTSTTGDQFTRVRNDELYAMQSRTYNETRELFVRQTSSVSGPVKSTRGTMAFVLNESSPGFNLDRVLRYTPGGGDLPTDYDGDFYYKRDNLVCTYGHDGGILVDIPESANYWVATVVFKSTVSRQPEVWVMLGWSERFRVSVHVCWGDKEELVSLDNCKRHGYIKREYENPEGGTYLESIRVSASVDTLHERGPHALYKVLHKVTLVNERSVETDTEEDTT